MKYRKLVGDPEERKFSIPSNWGELTLLQYEKLSIIGDKPTPNDNIAYLELFTGIGREIWERTETKYVFSMIAEIEELLQLPIPEFSELSRPKELQISEGNSFEVESKVDNLPYGARLQIEALMKKDGKFTNYCELLCYAFYSQVTGEAYDMQKALTILPLIQELPAVKAFPWVMFFFLKLFPQSRVGKLRLANHLGHLNKLRLELKSWTSSEHGMPLQRFPKAIGQD